MVPAGFYFLLLPARMTGSDGNFDFLFSQFFPESHTTKLFYPSLDTFLGRNLF
jgi:hypothetical protein